MRQTVSQNQEVLNHIQSERILRKDNPQNKPTGPLARNIPLQSGLVVNNTGATASPGDNDNSYVKEVWYMVGPSGGPSGSVGRGKPMTGPVYQIQNVKPTSQMPGPTTATLNRSTRANVRFGDDTLLQSSPKMPIHPAEDQHIYESPDGLLKSYNTMNTGKCVANSISTLPRTLNKLQTSQIGYRVNYPKGISEDEEVWRRRSSKTETVVL